MNLIELRNVGVKYDSYVALRDVNLSIKSDDFIAIVGPNGGGKTSMVKAILGSVKYSGEIIFDNSLRAKDGRLMIGYMPQVSLFDRAFPITVEEVVLSGIPSQRGILGYSKYTKEEREKARELMARSSIDTIARKRIGEISGGQLQRALLCRAVVSDPKLLILDEPTNFVDNRFEGELYRLLKELHPKMAIAMISHDIGSVSTIVKQIVCVNGTVHRHESNIITNEQLASYNCPIQVISHGPIPHTVLPYHEDCDCCSGEKR